MAARGALGALAGQAFFSKALTPSLVNATIYSAMATIGEKSTNDGGKHWMIRENKSQRINHQRLFIHIAAAGIAAGLTPKLTQTFFNSKVSTKISMQLAGTNLAAHFIPAGLAYAKAKAE